MLTTFLAGRTPGGVKPGAVAGSDCKNLYGSSELTGFSPRYRILAIFLPRGFLSYGNE
jgi:hypothetical protein